MRLPGPMGRPGAHVGGLGRDRSEQLTVPLTGDAQHCTESSQPSVMQPRVHLAGEKTGAHRAHARSVCHPRPLPTAPVPSVTGGPHDVQAWHLTHRPTHTTGHSVSTAAAGTEGRRQGGLLCPGRENILAGSQGKWWMSYHEDPFPWALGGRLARQRTACASPSSSPRWGGIQKLCCCPLAQRVRHRRPPAEDSHLPAVCQAEQGLGGRVPSRPQGKGSAPPNPSLCTLSRLSGSPRTSAGYLPCPLGTSVPFTRGTQDR